MSRLAAPIKLPAADASALRAIVRKGTHKSRKITRARALFLMGAGKGRLAVQTAAGVSANQYDTLKRRYLAQGLDGALEERPRSGQPRKVTAALEARITSLACSELLAGAARWTVSLLNENLVSLDYMEKISDESIRLGTSLNQKNTILSVIMLIFCLLSAPVLVISPSNPCDDTPPRLSTPRLSQTQATLS